MCYLRLIFKPAIIVDKDHSDKGRFSDADDRQSKRSLNQNSGVENRGDADLMQRYKFEPTTCGTGAGSLTIRNHLGPSRVRAK